MWQVRSCSNCGNEIFAHHHEVDAMCDKCGEIEELRNKVERYEKVLKQIAFGEIKGWSGSDVLEKVVDLVKETLKS